MRRFEVQGAAIVEELKKSVSYECRPVEHEKVMVKFPVRVSYLIVLRSQNFLTDINRAWHFVVDSSRQNPR